MRVVGQVVPNPYSDAVSQQMAVHSLSCLMISRLPTICFSTVSPSPLTAEAPHQSPDDSSLYGSRKPGVTDRYISLRFINISISHSVKRSQKSMNISTTNDNESRNSPIYEVYVPRDKADVFSAIIGLRDDLFVISNSRTLFGAPISKTSILVYELDNSVDFIEVETHYGFKVGEATMEQSLIDVIRNDYWYYKGIAFETYYYAREYVLPEKLLEIAKRANIEKRMFTVDYVVSETLGEKPLRNCFGFRECL
jgi:hypothetical protein